MKAVVAQLKAELMRTVRNRRYMIFGLVMPMAFYLIFVAQVGGKAKVGGIDWSAYYLMSMTVFGVIGSSLNSLGINLANERTQGWLRLLKTTPLPAWVYLASKMFAQLLLNLGTIIVMFLVGHFAEHVDLSAGQWVGTTLWIWLSSLAFMSIGVFVGSIAGAQATQVVVAGVQMVFSLLGGLWTPMQFLPSWMKNFANYLPTYHMGSGGWNIIGGQMPQMVDFVNLICYLLVFMALSVWVNKRQEAVAA